MSENTKPTSNEAEYGNKSKPLLSVVFFAHFKSTNSESHRMERFFEEKTASDLFDWVCEKQNELEKEHSKNFTVTICHIVR